MTLKEFADGAFVILAILIVIFPIMSTAATTFLWWIFTSDTRNPKSWLLFMLASSSTVINIASFALAYLALRRFFQIELLPNEILLSMLGLSIVAIEFVPLYFAVKIARIRGFLRNKGETINGAEDQQESAAR